LAVNGIQKELRSFGTIVESGIYLSF